MIMDQISDKSKPAPGIRRHDLDWIRVIVFWILILFHIAVAFVPFGVYAYENNQTGGFLMELFLGFVHQWRLPALFIISGMGTCFALRRRTGKQFVLERTKRLLIPLFFGMNFVIIFAGYYAALHFGKVNSISDFIFGWWSHLGEIQHLWFLVNLFVYSMLCAPLFIYLRNKPDGFIPNTVKRIIGIPKGMGLLFLLPIPLIIVELLIKPWAYGVVGLGYELPWYLLFFLMGYLCIMSKDLYWKALKEVRYLSLGLGIMCSVLLFMLMSLADIIAPGYGNLLLNGGWLLVGDTFWGILTFPASLLHTLNAWFWCIAIFSWGAKYLNKPSTRLAYLNQGVYPFYIVHLPIILITLYYVKDWEIFWPVKFLLITVVTFVGCWIIFEIMKRNKVTRMLFGIKHLPKHKKI
jgi:peptidoglycan/LPS O-acetylase OafA/YrhL